MQRSGELTHAYPLPAAGSSTGGGPRGNCGFGVDPATQSAGVSGGGSFGQQQQQPPLPSHVPGVEQRACLEAQNYVQSAPASRLASSNGLGGSGSRQQLRAPLEPNTSAFRIEVHKGVLLFGAFLVF